MGEEKSVSPVLNPFTFRGSGTQGRVEWEIVMFAMLQVFLRKCNVILEGDTLTSWDRSKN